MLLDMNDRSLPVYKALSSPARLKIIRLLAARPYSIKELSAKLGISQTITLRHVNQLKAAGLLKFTKEGKSKISHLTVDDIKIQFPSQVQASSLSSHKVDIPVGLYTDFQIEPTCGLADLNGFIGKVDEPKYWMAPERRNARIIWFAKGYVEYEVGNFLEPGEQVQMLTLSAEMGSEIPMSNEDWPSDITFTLDGKELGTWTSPGDFADTRGKFTPLWTPAKFNQYGTQVTLIVSHEGTWISGQKISGTTIDDLTPLPSRMKLRIGVARDAKNQGGCTIFGKGFGNYDQEMCLTLYCS